MPQSILDDLVADGAVDYAAIFDGEGAVVAESGRLPAGAGDSQDLPPCTADASAGSVVPVLAQSQRLVGDATGAGEAVVAKNLRGELVTDVRTRSAADEVVLLNGRDVVFSTLDAGTTRTLVAATRGRTGLVDVGDWTARVDPPANGLPWTTVVAAQDPGTSSTTLFLLILLAGAVAAGILVAVVARGLSQPYTEIAEAAERVAGGDLDTAITPAPDGEAGRLGSAFNQMTDELRRSMAALERSREDLRDSLERIGDTLTSTHDLDGLLQVVLDTAVVTLQGRVRRRAADDRRPAAAGGRARAGRGRACRPRRS